MQTNVGEFSSMSGIVQANEEEYDNEEEYENTSSSQVDPNNFSRKVYKAKRLKN